jgi:hypothetical protein
MGRDGLGWFGQRASTSQSVPIPRSRGDSGASEESRRSSASADMPPGMLLIIDGSHVRQMAKRQPNGPELDYVRLKGFLESRFGCPIRESYFVDTFVTAGFEEFSLHTAGIEVVLGRMKKACYRRVALPHDMVQVHCQVMIYTPSGAHLR